MSYLVEQIRWNSAICFIPWDQSRLQNSLIFIKSYYNPLVHLSNSVQYNDNNNYHSRLAVRMSEASHILRLCNQMRSLFVIRKIEQYRERMTRSTQTTPKNMKDMIKQSSHTTTHHHINFTLLFLCFLAPSPPPPTPSPPTSTSPPPTTPLLSMSKICPGPQPPTPLSPSTLS